MPAPPTDAGVAWASRQIRAAGFAVLPSITGLSRGVGAAIWFDRWRAGPFGGDDRVELGPHQFLVGAEQFDELLVRGEGGVAIACSGRGHDAHPAQALITCRSSALVTVILRGLAFSATGICKVSTPLS